MRERVLRQLGGLGSVLSCADLSELRELLSSRAELMPGDPVRTAPVTPQGPVSWGELVVDQSGGQVTWRGDPLPLTPVERKLLALLIGPPLVVWGHEQLFAAIWSGPYRGSPIVHSAVRQLRHKLRDLPGGPRVHTVHGVGYRLDPPPRST
ncbi:winged helix-turn-helix transcriptional regulator [Micromonospora sp. STR1s_6]|uniref:Winged helix-turn-helix transcriptional regulator n=2 Tax=Micromonospora tarensis TaxID=2806100 RepID=A0ABS1YN32_9ACTN|nr:winged helix-turn-helix transcriptional regulator [Micromonospora tarensis]